MRRQEGVTLSGFIIVAVLGIFGLLAAFKIGPPYIEFMSIQKQLKAIANDPLSRSGDRKTIEGMFVSRSTIENITSITHQDLQIEKEPGGGVSLSAEYSVKVPLFSNLSACMDFYASSKK